MRQYAVDVCRDEPSARRDLLAEIEKWWTGHQRELAAGPDDALMFADDVEVGIDAVDEAGRSSSPLIKKVLGPQRGPFACVKRNERGVASSTVSARQPSHQTKRSHAMPRYFFNVVVGKRKSIPDPEGDLLSGDGAARRHAETIAREMLVDARLYKRGLHRWGSSLPQNGT